MVCGAAGLDNEPATALEDATGDDRWWSEQLYSHECRYVVVPFTGCCQGHVPPLSLFCLVLRGGVGQLEKHEPDTSAWDQLRIEHRYQKTPLSLPPWGEGVMSHRGDTAEKVCAWESAVSCACLFLVSQCHRGGAGGLQLVKGLLLTVDRWGLQ